MELLGAGWDVELLWDIGSLSGMNQEVCEELRKRMIDVCRLQISMFKIWWYSQQVRVARFTSTSSNLFNSNTPLQSAMCIFPSQTDLVTFFLNLPFPCPLHPPFHPLTFNPKIECTSQDMTILSPQYRVRLRRQIFRMLMMEGRRYKM